MVGSGENTSSAGSSPAHLLALSVRRLRAEFSWTTRAFSEHAGLSLGFLYRIEHAKHQTISLATLDRLARGFGVPAAHLLDGSIGRLPSVQQDSTAAIVAKNIVQLRTQQNWTQQELALRSGIARTTIADVERQAKNVSLDVLAKVASALKTRVADLLVPRQ